MDAFIHQVVSSRIASAQHIPGLAQLCQIGAPKMFLDSHMGWYHDNGIQVDLMPQLNTSFEPLD